MRRAGRHAGRFWAPESATEPAPVPDVLGFLLTLAVGAFVLLGALCAWLMIFGPKG